jgi:plasmid maintenance system killer protein
LKAPRDEGERPAAVKPPTLEGMDFRAVLVKVARRKLPYLNAAGDLGDLRSPPGNRLEALAGDCEGQYSIRINDQIRVFFVWTSASSTSSLSPLRPRAHPSRPRSRRGLLGDLRPSELVVCPSDAQLFSAACRSYFRAVPLISTFASGASQTSTTRRPMALINPYVCRCRGRDPIQSSLMCSYCTRRSYPGRTNSVLLVRRPLVIGQSGVVTPRSREPASGLGGVGGPW